MALVDIVRKAVHVADTVSKSMQVEAEIIPWTGQSGSGANRYGTPYLVQAIYEKKQRSIVNKNAEAIQSRHLLSILQPLPENGAPGREEPLDPRDKVLVDGEELGPIIDVEGLVDAATHGPFYALVWIGARTAGA